MKLRFATPAAWTQVVLNDFDAFLRDHANAERKASSLAMKLVVHYADRPTLVDAMVALAREELAHFAEVWKLLSARGLLLAPDERDPYINALAARAFRPGRDHYLMDRLLVASIVEARGHERFGLIAAALPAGALKDFYVAITRSEARHFTVFLDLAREFFGAADVDARCEFLLNLEAQIAAGLPLRAALH
jgi:tRNA 2-(methylsulfanyl)-N6-isopentenyladenosine37 hydroxylase